ncbi:MAG: hypothetical protein ACI9VT_001001 [Psychroserpens sp.]|jgi:hypothetical protein
MNRKVKGSALLALDLSKGIFVILIFLIGLKVFFNPTSDPSDVLIWRAFVIAVILIPTVLAGCFLYTYINYEDIIANDEREKNNKKK